MDIIREARRQHTERAMREAEERAERQARERQYRRLRDLRGKRKALPENIWAATGLANPGQARQGDPGRKFPYAIAITPNGKTAYVANFDSGTVTPIRTATNTAVRAINAGSRPGGVAITP